MTVYYADPELEINVALHTLNDSATSEKVPIRSVHGENTAYITAESGAASFEGDWIDCLNFPFISITTWWTAVASTAGTVYLQGTDDPAQTSGIDTFDDFNTTVDATAGYAAFRVKNPPRYLRVGFTRTAGGGAAQFNSAYTRRAA